jgi:bifunctional enzyme CysN/CysC
VTEDVTWHEGSIDRTTRWERLGATGAVVWLTGLSGSGKSSVAMAAEAKLVEARRPAVVLDGDNLRHGLCSDLGFSEADRVENIRRVTEVATLFAEAGVVALVPLVSPYRAARDAARARVEAADLRFVEVFVDTPLEECERRDPKGLYARARAGELSGLTGIDDPYEPPLTPELRLVPADGDVDAMARRLLDQLLAD